ncbi:acyl-CoA carboxylase subunit beta [Flammeovirga kamogawensis]|uniref:Acyl-CoA carboxylase subunit beta n=1 Tax=Flammeovirga kamogawensis TaxID=373891 RepID=A0ABX8GWB3_9BACT|nr:acyl-CoA carboxylase subunit beta [Flammeovirga kamogawensis]MBB6460528.1 acetyl-CoA carboxylase carboxyltransferase component [Flammeovirga kamogawensis]QWG07891.1 acyl-CoA carboxylase subunit beta [Flammeovirga kamogawensis]TRX69697.1 acyl-CoA carboxylase subunit beta [Flammeovirga kamogawensis]
MNTNQNSSQPTSFQALIDELKEKREKVFLGGGQKKIDKHKAKGKLTARERVDLLIDNKDSFIEIGTFTGEDMYTEHGGCPSGGVIVGIGKVANRQCVIVANDATVKAGAWFPITGKKNLRAQEIAIENKIPIIYLVDSAGVYLPLQDEIFPDKEHFGRIFRNNAIMSSEGIPQIAAIMGSCVAGGAYLPIMSDEALIVEGTGSVFLAGSYLVKSAIGESIDNETLGGATTHSEISGVTDYKCENDEACLNQIRSLMDKMGHNPKAGFDRSTPSLPKKLNAELVDLLPVDRTKPYNMIEIIQRIVDNSEFEQYKEGYGQSILCGYARIDGWAVGIVANQRTIVKSKTGEMQMGGVIYSDSADKSARFIMNCNQKKIPLLFIHDVTGFMVGSRSEHNGIIKDGAKMVNAMSNSVVPKFSLVIGNSYGAGNYAMCGKAYDPRLMLAWPTSQIAVMSGKSAATTLLQIKIATLKGQGKELSKEDEKELFDEIKAKYDSQLSPYYAASRLWIDEVIAPDETRKYLSLGIEAANHAPIEKRFNVGVIQA